MIGVSLKKMKPFEDGGIDGVTKNMGGSKIFLATYEVVDDAGYIIWSGIVNFQANTCTAFELTL